MVAVADASGSDTLPDTHLVEEATPTKETRVVVVENAIPQRAASPSTHRSPWAVRGVLIGLPLALLLLYLTWHFFLGGKHPPARPARLLQVPNLTLKAGKPLDVHLEVERGKEPGELRLMVEGLPEEWVKWAAPPIAAGQICSTLTLTAAGNCPELVLDVSVCLWGETLIQRLPVALRIEPFLRPSLKRIDSVVLEPGERRTVRIGVERNGNSDPLTVEIASLPDGVRQETANPTDGASEEVLLILVAEPRALPGQSCLAQVKLLADGAEGIGRSLRVEIQERKPPLGITLKPPAEVELVAGRTKTVAVEFERTGFTGEVTFRVQELPREVQCQEARAPQGANQVELKFRVSEALSSSKSAPVRLEALVDGKVVGETSFSLVLAPAPRAVEEIQIVGPAPRPIPLPEAVSFETADQVDIRGTFYPPIEKKKGLCILMLHDLNSRRSDPNWDRLARELQKAGHCVLTFDFRGYGDSTVISNPEVFWHEPLNSRGIKTTRRGTVIESQMFLRGYHVQLVQDIVAARLWLDLKHDDVGDINSRNLVVIGAGEGATWGALWLASEFWRSQMRLLASPREHESKDLAAAIWLGSSFTTAKPALTQNWLREGYRLPMLFLRSEGDEAARRVNEALIKKIRPEGGSTLLEERTIPGNQIGQGILRSNRADQMVKAFLDEMLRSHVMREWVPRKVQLNQYNWNLPGTPQTIPAKMSGVRNPSLFPVERLR
jgi:hypothetical protein